MKSLLNPKHCVDAPLAAVLVTATDELFPVVIRLYPAPPLGRELPAGPERVRALKAHFDVHAQPVLNVLSRSGAHDIHQLWIGNAVSARTSRATILALCDLDVVQEIQLIRRIIAIP